MPPLSRREFVGAAGAAGPTLFCSIPGGRGTAAATAAAVFEPNAWLTNTRRWRPTGRTSAYPVLRIDEVPEVELHLGENTEPPSGTGEQATAVVAPALSNAIFAATGARVRSLPFSSRARPQGVA